MNATVLTRFEFCIQFNPLPSFSKGDQATNDKASSVNSRMKLTAISLIIPTELARKSELVTDL